VTARIDPKTGLLASPDEKNAIFEEFQKGDMPKQFAQHEESGAEKENSGGGGSESIF